MMTRSSYLALMLLCISTDANLKSKTVLGCGAGGAVLGYSLSNTDLCKPSDGKPKALLCEAGTAAFFGGIIGLYVGEVLSRCDLVCNVQGNYHKQNYMFSWGTGKYSLSISSLPGKQKEAEHRATVKTNGESSSTILKLPSSVKFQATGKNADDFNRVKKALSQYTGDKSASWLPKAAEKNFEVTIEPSS